MDERVKGLGMGKRGEKGALEHGGEDRREHWSMEHRGEDQELEG